MTIENSCCVITCDVRADGKTRKCILMVRHPETKEWSVPGGKKNGTEDDFYTLKREFREETGMTLPDIRGYEMVIYMGRTAIYFKNNVWINLKYFRQNSEADQIRWVPIETFSNDFSTFKGTSGRIHYLRNYVGHSLTKYKHLFT